ncbi:MAG: type II restriction endonuclease [Armatimonadetes bacterium]|nr:type II restriction endonuclease [Armatimonadota bacterium]MDE2205637.1 type II restriction endonuclease [Armatimonadota bacterium]
MAIADVSDWLDDFASPDTVWYVKRLSGNDTLANGSHQAGPYVPREFMFQVFPAVNRTDIKNPNVWFDLYVDSGVDHRKVRAVYYNNALFGGTRNEARLTNLGGQSSALLDPDSTGALTVFAFRLDSAGPAIDCHVWVCQHETEEDLVEDRVGPVDPGRFLIWSPVKAPANLAQPDAPPHTSCWLERADMPPAWLSDFPAAAEIVHKAVELRPLPTLPPDQRLMQRRECEFELFRSIEDAVELPHILAGFKTVDDFVHRAQTVLQRRRMRAGRSLELHAREIFIEERLVENQHFSYQPVSEGTKKPDFLFPSQGAYQDVSFPASGLRMLAVKTTCKDRWRQILNEADRIPNKHLLTLQEGVSVSQFAEMSGAGVQLVVPAQRVASFPKEVQPHLQTLESFIGDVRLLTVSP